jgi:apolipoprotein N-acyltransferase
MAFAAWALNGLNLVSFMLRLAPPPLVAAIVLVPALAFALCVLAARRAVRRLPPGAAVFAFPLAWTAIEFLLSLPSPHGTAGSLAYTQTDVLPLIQIASLTGLPGITFLLMLSPSALAVAWHLRADRRLAVQALAGPFALLVLALSWGGLRLAQPAGNQPVRVGLAATDGTVASFRTENPAEALPVVRAYARRVADLAHQGAAVVVLPEKFVGVTPAYEEEVDRIFSETARQNQVTIIAGLNRIGRPVAHNTAVAYSPAGQVVARYEKIHLLPAFEADPPG